VEREQGRLDVLANSVAGQDMVLAGWEPIWKTDLARADLAVRQGLLSHVLTAKYAATLMIKKRHGLIVEVTEFDLLFCSGNVLAQLVKFSLKGLAVILAEELRKHRVAAVAMTPGYLRSELMLDHFGVTEENWQEGGKQDPNFLVSETPLFIGRAVAALAGDPKVLARSGQITSSYGLAREYGFTDYDGRRPDMLTHFAKEVLPSLKWMRDGLERHLAWLEDLTGVAREYLGQPRSATP